MSLIERAVQSERRTSFYHYDPSQAVSIIAAVLYTIAFVLTAIQWIRYRAWIWSIMVISAAMEAIGYIGRCVSVQNKLEKSVYVLQFSLIILAPVLMAACCYILFSRILFLIVPREARTFRLCWVPPQFITPIFVGFDILALLLQLGGAVMITSVDAADKDAKNKLNTGKHVAQIGVVIQLVAFGLFAVAAVRFNFTSKRFISSLSERFENVGKTGYRIDGIIKNKHWPALLRVVNITTILILVRSVYRLVEFTEGTTGYLGTHEWPLVKEIIMEGLFTLLALSIVMAITSFVVGSLPLAFTLSPSQLRLISSIGMGVLVGTSLIVIIPEGIETLYSANSLTRKQHSTRATAIEWQHQASAVATFGANGDSASNLPSDTPVPGLLLERDQLSKPQTVYVRTEDSTGESTDKDTIHGEEESSPHAWVGIALISGFILMYLVDKLPEFAAPTKHERTPYHISLDNLGSGLRRGSSPSRDGGLLDASHASRRGHSFATTTGLVIHAAADGIALGASSSDAGLSFIIFLAIMVHKAPASFGLTSILLKQGLSSRTARAHLLVFSLAAPFGALATFLFVQMMGSSSADEAGTHWRTGMLLLFSGGTFLYVAMHTMQENGPGSSSRELPTNGYGDRDQDGSGKSMRDLIASVLGMILPLFLQIGHAH
ncbi:ZIP metal ion transporter [Penicillium cf. griseofulvum]|uniref:ZIP metal ion transporter n=1 Tax=Penicillium cf. griseofulvum TaxID=2972120 RepID=A0A9W9MPX8_9EURO|nr:ZIP metal ion transporter [Penicillium cf. griseofulvum]KAJ5437569.1 ZIP metal ion transporter [Penicillium cf. griseofulvum]KAJ5441715.1 ZIP metal ion transporter [Penicillium cf. griseofulvum]